MKHSLLVVFLTLSFFKAFPQTDSTATADSFIINITQDAAFGFYPSVVGSIGTKKKFDVTYYGIFWTNRAYAVSDQSHWLETGVGLSFTKGNWYINPQIGITNGVLLSGASEGKIAEGIVPGIVISNESSRFELEYFGCLYKYTKKRSDLASDFLLTWVYSGYRFSPRFSAGVHAETFYQLTDPHRVSYGTVGGYVKAIAAQKYSVRLTIGRNVLQNSTYSSQFYRLSTNIPLN